MDTDPVINFVSAGNSVPDDILKPTDSPPAPPRVTPPTSLPQASLASLTIEDQVTEGPDDHTDIKKFDNGAATDAPIRSAYTQESDGHQPKHEMFFMDSTGSQVSSKFRLDSPKLPRSLSPTPSDSSDEIIVFTGRRAAYQSVPEQGRNESGIHSDGNNLMSKNDDQINTDRRLYDQSPSPVENPIDGQHQRSKTPVRNLRSSPIASKEDDLTMPVATSGRRRQKRQRRLRKSRSQAVEEEMLADYIENMAAEDAHAAIPSGLSLNGSLAANPQTMPTSPSAMDTDAAEEAIDSLLNQSPNWDSNDIRDFDDLSTSTEGYSILDKVLASRHRPTGQQYLVVGQNQSIDEARWIPLSSLSSAHARERIRIFELTREDFETGDFSNEDSDDSIDDAQLSADLREDLESMEDERDLVERRQATMTDERIARLLSKQEELGLGSSELLLFDGGDDNDGADEDEDNLPLAAFTRLKKARAKKTRQPRGILASASLFAQELEHEPYGDFDVMDHDRLSLRKKPKGRRGAPTFDLSDVELEASLQSAWEKDRSKKKI
ncbi:MAG: hypothetical protein Q9180_004625, partial [Flavoplaca navasiana]